jgi:hypothetical protein
MATEAVLMADQKSKLIRREEVAEGTMAFHFEKPFRFAFKAGQSADVTLIDPPDTDAEGNTRTFPSRVLPLKMSWSSPLGCVTPLSNAR